MTKYPLPWSPSHQGFCLVPLILTALAGCKTPDNQGSSAKMINGEKVEATNPIAASTVGLAWDNGSSGTAACSGTLIDSRHVLTAAHCFDTALTGLPGHLHVTFGTTRDPVTVNGVDYKPVAKIDVASYVANADYTFSPTRPNTFSNADLAVITLAASAPQGFTPVGLLTPADSLKVGDAIIPAGFGVTQWDDTSTAGTMHSINQHLDKDPDPSVPEITYSIFNPRGSVGSPDSGIGCFGDSGGPIYVQRNGKLLLAAVTKGGNGYRCTNGSANATDVRPLQSWVQQAMAGTLPANQGFVFPDHFTDKDGTVYPFCSRGAKDDGTGNYIFGIDPALNGPGGKCKLLRGNG